MKKIALLFILLVSSVVTVAQSPQFAVVRSNGTTYIYSSWDSAYANAQDNDHIYLPGGIIPTTGTIITKKLFIYGAGHHPDSTTATSPSVFQQNIRIAKGADNGMIEGVYFLNSIIFGTAISGANRGNVQNFTIKRCRIDNLMFNNSLNSNTASPDSLPGNLTIAENIIVGIFATYGNSINNLFIRNIILSAVTNVQFSSFNNNIFLAGPGTPVPVVYCSFYNNIFCTTTSLSQCTNNFYNNLKVGSINFLTGCAPGDGNQSGNISVTSVSDIFISYTGNSNFAYTDNYHLKPTCPGVNAGTDGTDVGIYGTTNPTAEGWVPSNPHIYFKQVAPQTNASGQLPVQFKVRTNN